MPYEIMATHFYSVRFRKIVYFISFFKVILAITINHAEFHLILTCDTVKMRLNYFFFINDSVIVDGCTNQKIVFVFIFFNRCNIISLNDSKRSIHYISAPAHPKEDKFGYLFYKCNIINEGKANLYYGRPWRDYGCSAFIDCYSKDITPEGFNNWVMERENTARFYEYSPNLNTSDRVKWANILNKDEADKYVKDYLAYINYKEELN